MPYETRVIWNKIKTATVVVVITFLIWFAADQNVMEPESFGIPIRLASADPDRYAGLAEAPYQVTLRVTLRGRRRHLQDFAEQLKSQSVFVANIDESKPTSKTPQPISVIDDVLSTIKLIQESHLAIASVEPMTLSARIDKYEHLQGVHVKPDYGDLKVSAELSPQTVSVRLPRFAADLLGSAPVAAAAAEQRIRAAQVADGRFEIKAPLTFPTLKDLDPNLPIEFLPAGEVTIKGRIEALTETQRKGPIQITWSIPDDVQAKYVVVATDANFRVNIDVTGPKNRLDQLEPGDILGLVEVFAGDMDDPGPGKEITREVRFILAAPAKFPDCKLSSEAHEVRFRLEPRPAGSVAPSPK